MEPDGGINGCTEAGSDRGQSYIYLPVAAHPRHSGEYYFINFLPNVASFKETKCCVESPS